jgi:hypothetical protein
MLVVCGSLIMGILMGCREQVHSIWLRALVAGVAFGIFVTPFLFFRKTSATEVRDRVDEREHH